MFSYFTPTSKSQEMRVQVQCYKDRLKDFVTNFAIDIPRLALSKMHDVSRHSGALSTTINIIKLAEEYHADHAAFYKNYNIALNESEFDEMMKSLKTFLMQEKFNVTETINAEGVRELLVEWSE